MIKSPLSVAPNDDTLARFTLSEALSLTSPPIPWSENESMFSVEVISPISLSTLISPPCSIPSERIPLMVIFPGDVRFTSPAIPVVENVFNAPWTLMLFSLRLSMVMSPPRCVPWESMFSMLTEPSAIIFTFPAVPCWENVSISWVALISPC